MCSLYQLAFLFGSTLFVHGGVNSANMVLCVLWALLLLGFLSWTEGCSLILSLLASSKRSLLYINPYSAAVPTTGSCQSMLSCCTCYYMHANVCSLQHLSVHAQIFFNWSQRFLPDSHAPSTEVLNEVAVLPSHPAAPQRLLGDAVTGWPESCKEYSCDMRMLCLWDYY